MPKITVKSKSKKSSNGRPSKEEYYLNIAKEVAKRSPCYRVMHGAIIVRGDQIVSTGYNGAPRKTKDCFERGFCLRDKLNVPHGQRYEVCRSVHAEQNAIINAARAGVSVFGGDMYLYSEETGKNKIDAYPCFFCKRMVINAGLERVIAATKNGYRIFKIKDWVTEWQKKDIIDDKHQYGNGLNKLLNKKRVK
jgi:dCMP deaminase